MRKLTEKILKFLFGFCLAILLSGFIYNYFPDLWEIAKNTGFFMASLVNSQDQKLEKIVLQSSQDPLLQEITQEKDEVAKEADHAEIGWGRTSDEISQDELDDLAEQIDILRRKINDLLAEKLQITNNKLQENPEDKDLEDEKELEEKDLEEETDNDDEQVDIELVEIDRNKTNYLQILISEVQIAGESDDKQEFVELYNPNESAIDLTGWYLQRKTKTADNFSTYVPSDSFSGKIINAKSYFLIAREGFYFTSFADIITKNPLTEDNSLILKNPNRETSDLLGFGQASEFWGNTALNPVNGKTIGRKWIGDSEQNIGSNNLDFELQIPTPRNQNIKYIEPVVLPITGGGGGGGIPAEIIYDKILISEILLGDNEFIELYNPNNIDIDLSNWYLQRKTKTAENYSSYVTKTDFEGKKILANNYFLIVRQGSIYENIADIVFDEPLTQDNSLVLKNPKQEISDKLGFGQASDSENLSSLLAQSEKSLGRKIVDNLEQDTDNNFNDFEIQILTPKVQNITFVEPPVIEIPKDTTPPEVAFGLLSAVQTSLNFSINFEITDLLGTVTPSGLASYIFRWNDLDPAIAENWHEYVKEEISGHPMSTQIVKEFIGEDQKTYYFQVKAKDNENNCSEFLPQEPIFTKIELPSPIELLPIIINEVQIEGEEKSHDFIEIYNPNDIDILLDEYRLVKRSKTSSSDTTVKSWGIEDKILAKQYYLWASSTDENYSALIASDISTKQNISDNNGVAIRKGAEDTGEIIDAVAWGEFDNILFEGVSFSANPEKNKSISRLNGIDTNDNSKDFIILNTPTPKTE